MNIPHAACTAIFRRCLQSFSLVLSPVFYGMTQVEERTKLSCAHSSTPTHQLRFLSTGASTQCTFSSQSRCRSLYNSDHENGPLCSLLLQIRTPEPTAQFGNNQEVSPNSHGSLVSERYYSTVRFSETRQEEFSATLIAPVL
jgi:hypothetical protein